MRRGGRGREGERERDIVRKGTSDRLNAHADYSPTKKKHATEKEGGNEGTNRRKE
jgi:hypothetical protein